MLKSILIFLKPSALVGVLFTLLLLVYSVLFSSVSYTTSFTPPGEVAEVSRIESAYGFGGPITVTIVNGTATRTVHWPLLLLTLAVAYLFAAILAELLTRATRFRHPARACVLFALAIVAITFLASIGISRWYWGYFFSRPGPLTEIHDVTTVTAVIPVSTVADSDDTRSIVPMTEYSIAEEIARGRQTPYYCLHQRLLLALDTAGLLPSTHAVELPDLPALFPLIQAAGILAKPEPGYNNSDLLQGIVIDARNRSGERLLFIGLTGRELSNDHYPYYEMVFSSTPDTNTLTYLRGQRFFYDIAGMEGMEWYSIWALLACTGLVLSIPVILLLAFQARARSKR